MRKLPSERWLAVGSALIGVGGALAAAFWIYILQSSSHEGFWQLPGYVAIGLLALGLLFLAVGFFAPSPREDTSRRKLEKQQRLRRRQRFAKDVRRKLQLLEGKEWSDERFTELEAQVIIERTTRSRFAVLNLRRPGRALRYQRSLTKALRRSNEEMILLQGDPGCGKSVALRHVALAMAERAAKTRSVDAVIPLYVNLKGLRRNGRAIDADLIQHYVNETLRDDINADIERFLDEEYEQGLTDGTWFLLFDSFDEMPDILGSSRLDETVRDYSQAIATFLNGMRPCRGVVASREFHSPKGLPWPRWQIRPLTGKRQRTLVHRYLLDRDKEGILLAGLEVADSGVVQDASNPLFLSLLAEYVRHADGFPLSSHDVYETYISLRLMTDTRRVHDRFGVDTDDVRAVAERIAFCMADENGLGLEPSRGELLDVLEQRGLAQAADAMICMDALEYLKLVQGHSEGSNLRARVFTFAHRRFQEYFTTSAVLRRVGDVSVDALLSDLRWRETAVALCQLQRDSSAPLVERAGEIIAEGLSTLEGLSEGEKVALAAGESALPTEQIDEPWPALTLEILGILQAGFSNGPDRLPMDVREHIGRLLECVYWRGLTYDRAAAVSVAGIAPRETFDAIISGAFRGGSQLLADESYRQVARLRTLPTDFASEIRRTLLRMLADGTLRREALTVRTQLKRFDAPRSLLRAQRMTLLVPQVDVVLLIGFITFQVMSQNVALGVGLSVFVVTMAFVAHATLYGFSASLGGASAGVGLRASETAVISVMLRLYMCAILAFSLHGLRDQWLFVAAALIAVAWAPSALIAVRAGEFMLPAAYPFVLLSPLEMILRALRTLPKKDVLRGLGVILAMAAAFALVIILLSLIPASWQKIVVLGFGGVIGILGAPSMLKTTSRILRDVMWYRRWDAQRTTALSLPELMNLFVQIHTVSTATRVLADLRISERLQPGPEIYAFLADLAHAAQLYSPQEIQSAQWRTPGIVEWFEDTPLVGSARVAANRGFEDEVARLVRALRERSEDHASRAVSLDPM